MIFVVEVFSPSRQAWKPTSNVRDTLPEAQRIADHLNQIYPGKRRRVRSYEPARASTTSPPSLPPPAPRNA